MSVPKKIFEFYLNSSVHVSLAVCAFVRLTQLAFGILYDLDLMVFVFFACITGYNFVKYAGVARFHHRSLTTMLRSVQVFSLMSFVLMTFYFFRLEWDTQRYVIIMGGVTFLYAMPFTANLSERYQSGLRSISGLKIYVVGLVWAITTVLFPLMQSGIEVDLWVLSVLLLQRFMMVVVLMFPFEIRDLKYDAFNLNTIPQQLGVLKTKRLGYGLLLLVILLAVLLKFQIVSTSVVMFILGFFLLETTKEQSPYFSSFWVESIPLFLWLVERIVLIFI